MALVNIIAILLLLVVLALVAFRLKKAGRAGKDDFAHVGNHPYTPKPDLLTASEIAFLSMLEQIIDRRYRILTKVSLANMLEVDAGLAEEAQKSAALALCGSVLDAVICDRKTYKILGAVQIDSDIDSEDARRRIDAFTDNALATAGIPVIHLPAQERYSPREIQIELSRSLFLKWNEDLEATTERANVQKSSSSRQASTAEKSLGRCPACGSRMIRRQAKSGKFAGKYLVACTNYPRCKHLRFIKDDSPLASGSA